MWRPTQVETRKHHDLPGAVLHFDFEKIDATTAQVEQKFSRPSFDRSDSEIF